MTERYVEIFLGSPDGLQGLLHSSLHELLSFYKESLWYGLPREVMNYVESLDFGSALEPKKETQARYIDKFIEYVFDFYSEHHDFPESLGNTWCLESEIEHVFSPTGRRIFSGHGTEFDAGYESTTIGYFTHSELKSIEITKSGKFLELFDSVRQLAIARGCGIVYSID